MRPDPGSLEAVARGCTCPRAQPDVMLVRLADGDEMPVFEFDRDCPLHGDGDWRDR